MVSLNDAARIVAILLTVSMAGATFWLGENDKLRAAAMTCALAALFALIAFPGIIRRLKAPGVEAELAEEIDKVTELRRGLKDLSERIGESVYWHLGEGSRAERPDFARIHGIIQRTDRDLQALGVEERELEELKRPWHKCVMRDLALPIARAVQVEVTRSRGPLDKKKRELGRIITAENRPLHDDIDQQIRACRQAGAAFQKLIWSDDWENVPSELRKAIDTCPYLGQGQRESVYNECSERFDDIDQYAVDRTIRRPHVLDNWASFPS